MSDRERLSLEAAEALAEVLLADAMRERKARLATIAMIKDWLTPWYVGSGWSSPTSFKYGLDVFDTRASTMSNDAYAPMLRASQPPSVLESSHSRCWMQDFGHGCLWNAWQHHQDMSSSWPHVRDFSSPFRSTFDSFNWSDTSRSLSHCWSSGSW